VKSIQEQFEEYHRLNPQVYQQFKRFAMELWAAGRRKMSAGLIFERIRWESAIKTIDPEGYKLNDRWEPRYARLLVAECPEFKDAFAFRRLRT
jgi:hypothetical protein